MYKKKNGIRIPYVWIICILIGFWVLYNNVLDIEDEMRFLIGFILIVFSVYMINVFYTKESEKSNDVLYTKKEGKQEVNKIELLKEEQKKEIEPLKEENVVKKGYVLPRLTLLNPDSNGIRFFLEKEKSNKDLLIPIGIKEDDYILEKMSDMPNLLIGGTVMSGKSTYINSIITSILMTKKPDEVKFVIYDSKKIEYSNYNGVPHLLLPVVTDPKRASATLQRIVVEMDNRYRVFEENQIKRIDDYNDLMVRKEHEEAKMPYIVVIIDDIMELMAVAKKEVEGYITRVTQMGWNVGIHLIVVANHPSSDIMNTISKGNFPSRMSFKVTSSRDSILIIDEPGAEKLTGSGSALYISRMLNKPLYIKTPLVTDDEIERVIWACKEQQATVYDESLSSDDDESDAINPLLGGTDDDPLYNEIVEFAMETGKVSASLLQRRFRLTYNRAAKIVDTLEARGIIGPAIGSKPREVLIDKNDD